MGKCTGTTLGTTNKMHSMMGSCLNFKVLRLLQIRHTEGTEQGETSRYKRVIAR